MVAAGAATVAAVGRNDDDAGRNRTTKSSSIAAAVNVSGVQKRWLPRRLASPSAQPFLVGGVFNTVNDPSICNTRGAEASQDAYFWKVLRLDRSLGACDQVA
jgi:hypothetical protein